MLVEKCTRLALSGLRRLILWNHFVLPRQLERILVGMTIVSVGGQVDFSVLLAGLRTRYILQLHRHRALDMHVQRRRPAIQVGNLEVLPSQRTGKDFSSGVAVAWRRRAQVQRHLIAALRGSPSTHNRMIVGREVTLRRTSQAHQLEPLLQHATQRFPSLERDLSQR